MNRRDFVKYAGGGISALLVGSVMPSWISKNPLFATSTNQVQELNFTITDAMKDMVTHNSINKASDSMFGCYMRPVPTYLQR